jgi:hypothetical protein
MVQFVWAKAGAVIPTHIARAADAIKALRFMVPLVLAPLRICPREFQKPETEPKPDRRPRSSPPRSRDSIQLKLSVLVMHFLYQ